MPTLNMLAMMVAAMAVQALADPPADRPTAGDPAVVAVRIVPPAPLAAATPQPLICKSSIETGSLIKRHRQCLSQAQWRYIDDVSHQQNQQLFDDQRTKQGCGGPAC
jgi:hypothetical protein